MRAIHWFLRAALFFLVLAFALRNQHTVSLHGLLGLEWSAPLAWVLLLTLLLGSGLGLLALAPSWWRQRRELQRLSAAAGSVSTATAPMPLPDVPLPEHPPRDGL